ncbi:MAG: hypothetical protein ABIP81_09055 [Terriglobales bacterium]
MDSLQFVSQYGYSVLFLWVLAEQVGFPIPAIPVLLAAGALSATGRMSLSLALLVTLIAATAAEGAGCKRTALRECAVCLGGT